MVFSIPCFSIPKSRIFNHLYTVAMQPFKIVVLGFLLLGIVPSLRAQGVPHKLHHLVLFQWVENPDEAVQDEILELFAGLPAKVEGMESVQFVSLLRSSEDFDLGIIMIFDSEEAQKAYETHPDHVRITQIAPPLLSGFSKFDYWE